MEQRTQRTEKLLFGTLSVFLLALAFNFFTGEFRPTQSVSASDDQSEASAPSTKSSDDEDEKSNDEESNDEPSTKSEDEKSVDEPSVKSSKTTTTAKPVVKSGVSNQGKEASVDEVSTASVDEVSVKSVKTENSVASTSTDEASDGDGDSGLGGQERSDASDEMPVAISDPNATETVMVKSKERLFFIVPVEVESERLVDGNGNVISERKDFINWLKSIFSL